MAQHHQASLLDHLEPPTAEHLGRPERTPWHFAETNHIRVEQSTDRCLECQAVLVVRERVGTMNWNVIYRISKAEHADECVARNPTRANIEKAIQDAYARNEPLAVIQELEQLGRPRERAA